MPEAKSGTFATNRVIVTGSPFEGIWGSHALDTTRFVKLQHIPKHEQAVWLEGQPPPSWETKSARELAI